MIRENDPVWYARYMADYPNPEFTVPEVTEKGRNYNLYQIRVINWPGIFYINYTDKDDKVNIIDYGDDLVSEIEYQRF